MMSRNQREKSVNILHVDDEPDFADMAAAFLERENERFEVETVHDANEGLDLITAEDYDYIISDYDMPHMDGLDLLTAVREEYPDLPFILFTGKGNEEIALEALNKGANMYLEKSGDPDSQYRSLIQVSVEEALHKRKTEELKNKLEKTKLNNN